MHNPNLKGVEIDTFKSEAGTHYFTMSPQRWIKETNVMGIISKSGNNGGTYAHPDIAIERIFKMKRKIIIISCISLLAIAILVICINLHTMPTEALTKEEAIELMKKVENYNNIHITTYMDKNNSLVTDFYKKDNIELSKSKIGNEERIIWTDDNTKQSIILDTQYKVYQIVSEYNPENTIELEDSRSSYKFIRI